MSDLQVQPIPAFDDNYIWLLTRPGSDRCAVVDPGDEDPVIECLRSEQLMLDAILITHKHGDHVGGIAGLKAAWPEAAVWGPAGERIRGIERPLQDGERIEVLGSVFEVLAVPGHTEGHIAYFGEGALFCGDTLFAAGCGRVFSGTFEQLADSLDRLAQLPGSTRVFCAHEYTLANLGFAQWVEPDSEALRQRVERDRATRARGEPTVPSTMALECATNPFLRTGVPAVHAAIERWAGEPLATRHQRFRALRQWKDRDYD